MIVKRIFLIMFFISSLSLRSVCSMDMQEQTVSIEDVTKLRSWLRGEDTVHIITINCNSNQFEEKKELINDLQDGLKRAYCSENIEFVSDDIKKNFSSFWKSSESLEKNKQEILSFMKKIEEKDMTYGDYIKFAEMTQKLQENLERNFFEIQLENQIFKQKELIKWRGKTFFSDLETFIKNSNLLNNPIICVTQEAFLNYWDNPEGTGNFIPFEEEDYSIFIKNLKEFSKKYSNVIVIPNLVYRSKIKDEDITLSIKNFEDLKKKSYQQSNLLNRFYGLIDSKKQDAIHMIRNQSSIYWKGHQFSNYDKEYLLESDIPFKYYPDDFYFPGVNPEIKTTEMSKFFSIEICQDHIEKSKSNLYNLPSLVHIVQSATINLADSELHKKKYTGLIAHADSNQVLNEVWFYTNGIGKPLNHINEHETDTFYFKLWDIQKDLKKVNEAQEDSLSKKMMKEINSIN